jgi:ElaB/YqjD/DUF883 family membrane-anchored ribosome-binding protein
MKKKSNLAEAAHGVIDDIASKAEAIEVSQEQAVEKISRSISDAEAFAKERPVTAAGIAFALGILTSVLLRR